MFGKLADMVESKVGVDLDHDGDVAGVKVEDGDGSGSTAAMLGAAAAAYFGSGGDDEDSDEDEEDDHSAVLALIAAGAVVGVAALAFCYAMHQKKKRQYVVIVDASASMQSGVFVPLGGTRWSETQKALNYLAEGACQSDPDGVTLYFFNDYVKKFENIRSEDDVANIFNTFQPDGFTDLASALDQAFEEHFTRKSKRPTTILVIHDGQPNEPEKAKQSIQAAVEKMKKKNELHVSFVQVGDDAEATAFLHDLDEGLGTKFDIIDTVKANQLEGSAFSTAIQEGVLA